MLVLSFLSLSVLAQLGPQRTAGPRVELVEATLSELQFALRTGQVTSAELVGGYLARIATYDDGAPFLNGMLSVNPIVFDEAVASDLVRAAGFAHGPLFGVPVVVKDNIDVAGMDTTAGSRALAGSRAPNDAFLVRKLRAAGAIVLGKTTLTEFANFMTTGMPSGYSSLGGYGFNPYDPRPAPGGDGRPALTPGGSSSGTGIAIAASLAAVGVGTETSGSILSPSSSNCLVGIKPTLGLISRDGILPITADQDTPGPMARTVTDAAILLGVLAGYDPADPATAPCASRGACPGDYTRFLDKHALAGARIAVPHSPYWDALSGDERSLMRAAVRVIQDQGAVLVSPFELPHQDQMNQRGIAVTYPPPPSDSSVLLYGFKHDLNRYFASLGPFVPIHSLAEVIAFNSAHPLECLKYGQSIALAADRIDDSPGSGDTRRYQNDRARDIALFRGALDEAFAGPDALPGTGDEFDAILFPANFGADPPARAGYPSVCVPGGFIARDGGLPDRPFGVTFCGPAFSEPRLIALAFAFEQVTKVRRAPPGMP